MIGNNNTPHEDVLLCACAHPHVSLRYNRFSHKWVTIDSHKGTIQCTCYNGFSGGLIGRDHSMPGHGSAAD